jgi:hypothetical protein
MATRSSSRLIILLKGNSSTWVCTRSRRNAFWACCETALTNFWWFQCEETCLQLLKGHTSLPGLHEVQVSPFLWFNCVIPRHVRVALNSSSFKLLKSPQSKHALAFIQLFPWEVMERWRMRDNVNLLKEFCEAFSDIGASWFYFMLTCWTIMEIEFERNFLLIVFGFVEVLRYLGLMATNESMHG